MSEKRKISVRKIMQTLFTLVVAAACVTAILSASKIENEKSLTGVEVNIKNDKFHFVDQQSILNIVTKNKQLDIQKIPLGKLDVHTMETAIKANPWVADAQLFIDNSHVLHINVNQRVPVARLFEENGNSYYLDTTLSAMPLSKDYIYYTTVVTNVPVIKKDSIGNALKSQIVSLVRYIENDTFWNAQISQISVDSTGSSFELVPVLGTQKIVFGDTSRMRDKFDNLFVFYKKILNNIGWDRYETLDLRYKGQVVASPSIPFKGPVDKVMNNMAWVQSIIDSDPKGTTSDSGKTKTAAPTGTPAPAKLVAINQAAAKPVVSAKPAQKTVTHTDKAASKSIAQKPGAPVVKPIVQKQPVAAKHTDKPAVVNKIVKENKAVAKPVTKITNTKPAPAKDKNNDQKKITDKDKKSVANPADRKPPTPKYLYQGQ